MIRRVTDVWHTARYDRPPKAGEYTVVTDDGVERQALYVLRKDAFVELDGSTAIDVLLWKANADPS